MTQPQHDHGRYSCACHGRVMRCPDCPGAFFDLNEWARHILGGDHFPAPEDLV